MLSGLTIVVVAAAFLVGIAAAVYAVTSRPVDDRLLLLVAILEVALLIQVGVGLVRGIGRTGEFEKPVFLAYLLTLPFLTPVATFLALKEKTRSSMFVVLGAAAVVGLFMARLTQMWNVGG